MDIPPVDAGYPLIVPGKQVTYLHEPDEEIAGKMMALAVLLNRALRGSGLLCEGANLSLADGEAAMQEVFYAHLHVFPSYPGDGFGLKFGKHYFKLPSREDLDRTGQMIS